jgi:hypothetical protein
MEIVSDGRSREQGGLRLFKFPVQWESFSFLDTFGGLQKKT